MSKGVTVDRRHLLGIKKNGTVAYKVIDELRLFWHVKGHFLTLRCFPDKAMLPRDHDEILFYLTKYTQLMTIPCFQILLKSQLAVLSKAMTMRDDRAMRFRINCTNPKIAEICILLSGDAVISSLDSEEEEQSVFLERGSIFGAVQLFQNIFSKREIPITSPPCIQVRVDKGTILRLSLQDYFSKIVLTNSMRRSILRSEKRLSMMSIAKIKSEEVEVMEPEEPIFSNTDEFLEMIEKISSILPVKIINFLKESKLHPPPIEYIHRGFKGRSIIIRAESEPMLYVVLDGMLKMDLLPNQRRKEGNNISHKLKGQKSARFKVFNSFFILMIRMLNTRLV